MRAGDTLGSERQLQLVYFLLEGTAAGERLLLRALQRRRGLVMLLLPALGIELLGRQHVFEGLALVLQIADRLIRGFKGLLEGVFFLRAVLTLNGELTLCFVQLRFELQVLFLAELDAAMQDRNLRLLRKHDTMD